MPIYEYRCKEHGLFEILTYEMDETYPCPLCGSQCARVISVTARPIIKEKERLPYGSGSRGKFIPAEETGGLPVFVPSFGAMEQEEVDYVAEVAVAKERERVAKGKPHTEQNALTKKAMENIVKVGKSQPEGKRAATMEKVKKEGLR